jgi:hypothetical protein
LPNPIWWGYIGIVEPLTEEVPMTAPLNHDWSIITTAQGGEVLARLDDSREGYVRVSYPEDLTETFLVEALRDKGVEVDLGVTPFYQSGESPGEAVALFKIA